MARTGPSSSDLTSSDVFADTRPPRGNQPVRESGIVLGRKHTMTMIEPFWTE
jgi:hypothetical protein